MIIKTDKDGMISLEPLMDAYPKLKRAVYYRLFIKKNKTIHVRFYDKNGRWIRKLSE